MALVRISYYDENRRRCAKLYLESADREVIARVRAMRHWTKDFEDTTCSFIKSEIVKL